MNDQKKHNYPYPLCLFCKSKIHITSDDPIEPGIARLIPNIPLKKLLRKRHVHMNETNLTKGERKKLEEERQKGELKSQLNQQFQIKYDEGVAQNQEQALREQRESQAIAQPANKMEQNINESTKFFVITIPNLETLRYA